MLLGEDDEEPQLNAVENYHLVYADNTPVSFSVLPFQFECTDEIPACKKDVSLWGKSDDGPRKVYKKVVAWKLGLDGERPEIAVLLAEGNWIGLLKPKNSYEEIARTILITVQMLHFLRRKPAEPEKKLWNHLHKVFNKFEVRPSEEDFRKHRSLIKLFAEKDPILSKSQILQAFIEERSRKKVGNVGSNNVEIKVPFIADDDDIEMFADDNKHESDEEEEEDLFDSVCSICDNGGDLLGCDGPCMRSFHAKIGTGEDSHCKTLGYTEKEVKAIQDFLCKNCEYKQHQCFICGELEPSDGPGAKVFLCNNATCGHFYHPKCVAQRFHHNNRNEAFELEKKIAAGCSFTCPIHWCCQCKSLEDRTQELLQFAICRRCPTSYHRKCLPREISFEPIEEEDIIQRAWKLSKRIVIYCLDHDIDSDIETPPRNHIKFPRIPEKKFVKKKYKVLVKKKKRTFDESFMDQPSKGPVKSSDKASMEESAQARKVVLKSSSEQLVLKPEKKEAKHLKEKRQPEPYMVKGACSSKPAKEQDKQLVSLPSSDVWKIPESTFPIVDSEAEKRVIDLVEKASSLILEDVSRKYMMPSTHAYSGKHIDKTIAWGKLERSVQAVKEALQILENGGNVDDAKAVCEPEVLRQLSKWNNKLRVYLAPFIHGMRYTSFGRHFTKIEKLVKIVGKLQWYVQPGDTIVDFCCGANDFSQLMKEKLDEVKKKCNFKNYDLIQTKNCFCFEKRDWMTVQPRELPHGSQLIMGLNPPFGVKAALANKFIDKALTFKPKLIILIVPKETERLDQKRTPYDLVWEDNECLSGKSFYLPGSVDVNSKQIEQWNASAPPLYLWSRPDWTKKHKKVAREHGHTSVERVASHFKDASVSNDLPVKKLAEAANQQNPRSGKERDPGRDENKRNPDKADSFAPEKLLEFPFKERKVVPSKESTQQEDQRDTCHRDGENACREEFNGAWHGDNRRAAEVSDSKFREKKESKKAAILAADVKMDSDKPISTTVPSFPSPHSFYWRQSSEDHFVDRTAEGSTDVAARNSVAGMSIRRRVRSGELSHGQARLAPRPNKP